MDIKDFIKETLCDVVNGITESNINTKEKGYTFSPETGKIEFDIAVLTTETEAKKKSGGLNKVVVASLAKNTESMNSETSRIKFNLWFSNYNPV